MTVTLLKPWNGWPAGHVFTAMQRGAARVLERMGVARINENDASRAGDKTASRKASARAPSSRSKRTRKRNA